MLSSLTGELWVTAHGKGVVGRSSARRGVGGQAVSFVCLWLAGQRGGGGWRPLAAVTSRSS